MNSQTAEQETEERGRSSRSTIEFPYTALDDAEEIASGIRSVGVTRCDIHQLAAKLGQSGDGGGFRQRLYGARTFGLLTIERGNVELTDLGIRIVDPKHAREARIAAFLGVALFKKTYDNLKGQQLPPPPAIERMMESAGVAPKQKSKARQTFMRSAKYAGFFELSADRLVMPAAGAMAQEPITQPTTHEIGAPPTFGGDGGDGCPPSIHPAILGLIRDLPQPGSVWTKKAKERFMAAFKANIDHIYPEEDV